MTSVLRTGKEKTVKDQYVIQNAQNMEIVSNSNRVSVIFLKLYMFVSVMKVGVVFLVKRQIVTAVTVMALVKNLTFVLVMRVGVVKLVINQIVTVVAIMVFV